MISWAALIIAAKKSPECRPPNFKSLEFKSSEHDSDFERFKKAPFTSKSCDSKAFIYTHT